MALNIFTGFSLDMAFDLSGMDKSEINRLRKNGVVSPPKTKRGFSYSFSNLLMLRLVKQLRVNDATLRDIKKAHDYLTDLDPEKSLREYKLYIRTDSKEIVYFGEKPDNDHALISASKFGQLLFAGLLVVIPVGKLQNLTLLAWTAMKHRRHKGRRCFDYINAARRFLGHVNLIGLQCSPGAPP